MARVPIVMLLVLVGCTSPVQRLDPWRVTQVPDSAFVRFVPASGQQPVTGRSLGWQHNAPHVITSRGDTLRVPEGSRVAMRANRKRGHPVAGAAVGYAIGLGLTTARYGFLSYRGRRDPTPLFTVAIGALAGSAIRTDRWIRLGWNSE